VRELTAGLLLAAVLVLAVYGLVDAAQAEPSRVRGLPLWAWRLALLVPVLGPAAWLLHGRPRAGHRIDLPGPAGPRRPVRRSARRTGPTRAGHATAGSLPPNWPVWPTDSLEPLESLESVGLLPHVVGPEDDPDFIAELARLVERRRRGDQSD
jgi:hypothetical protein